MRKDGWLAAVILALAPSLLTTPVFALDESDRFLKEARKAAKRDNGSREGRQWELKNNSWLGPALTPTLTRCKREAPDGEDKDFAMYLQLNANGGVVQSAFEPRTAFSACFRDGAAQLIYPNVPREGFWLEVKMHMHGKPPEQP